MAVEMLIFARYHEISLVKTEKGINS